MRGRSVRAALVAAVSLMLAGSLVACSEEASTINAQMRQGDEKGYIEGDRRIEQVAPEDRTTTIELTGTTLEGEDWSSSDLAAEALVVNVWGSWCGPCVAEAPDLAEVAGEHEGSEDVAFIGVNVRDAVESARAFEDRFDIPYPSLRDDGGRTLAQLKGMATARPTTLVLDGQGRIAARANGQIDASTLRGMIDDVLAGEATG